MQRLIAHPRVAALLLGAGAAAPGAVLTQLPALGDVAALLGIFTTTLGLASGLLGLWIYKINAQRDARQNERDNELKSLISELSSRMDKELLKMLLDLGEKYPDKQDLHERIGKLEQKADAAHRRLDEGGAKFADHDKRLAVIESQAPGDARRRTRNDPA